MITMSWAAFYLLVGIIAAFQFLDRDAIANTYREYGLLTTLGTLLVLLPVFIVVATLWPALIVLEIILKASGVTKK